jgi:hypothetical protein
MQIFETRYKADKEKKNSKWYSSFDITVKVDGGYTIMTPDEYKVWKNQK